MDDDFARQLQGHARAVRNLAFALLGDAAGAEDVAQEAVLLAHSRPPNTTLLRAWLLLVGRRLAGRRRRSERRRQLREGRAARPERQPSAAEDAQRIELLAALAAALATLPSEAREVVLLRHFDELPPRAIAARLQLTVEAVESRLRRAHAQLRARLQQHRPGADWRPGLLLLAGPGAWTPLPGAVAVGAKSKGIVAAVAVLLLAALVAWLGWPAPPARALPLPDAEVAAAVRPPAAADVARAVRTEAAAADVAPDALPSWTATVSGRVVDECRRPVAEAHVVAQIGQGTRVEAESGADGRFTLALPVERAWSCNGEVLAERGERTGLGQFFASAVGSTSYDVGVLALLPGGRLEVHASRGPSPLAGAKVTAVRATWLPGLRHAGITDASGFAVLQRLPPARYCVAAQDADGGFLLGEADVLAGRTAKLALDLSSSTPFEVEVLARKDCRPIAGAAVRVLFLGDTGEGMPARVPLADWLPLPHTGADGRALLLGLRRGAPVGFGASHPQWRRCLDTWHTDWSSPTPHQQLLLDDLGGATWQLADGEVPVPPDGTCFTVWNRRVALRGGSLCLPELAASDDEILAIGPGCCARLPVRADGAPAFLCRCSVRGGSRSPCAIQPAVRWPAGSCPPPASRGSPGRRTPTPTVAR